MRTFGPQSYDRLLDKILARDLRLDTDELDQMSELLDTQRCKLTEQIARGSECCPASWVATQAEAVGPHPGENQRSLRHVLIEPVAFGVRALEQKTGGSLLDASELFGVELVSGEFNGQ